MSQILIYFLCKNCNPLNKVTHFLPATSSKSWSPVKLPFLKTWLEVQPPTPAAERGRGAAPYLSTILYYEIIPLSRDITCLKI